MSNRYRWNPDGPLPVLADHSRAKHEILRSYLVNYLQILSQQPRSERLRITIVDGFAGGGLYQSEGSGTTAFGSPLVILQAIADARAAIAQERISRGVKAAYRIDAHVVLVESNKETADFLANALAKSPFADCDDTAVEILPRKFAEALPGIVAGIQRRQRAGRSIFVLDQFGYSKVDVAQIREIFESLPRAEVFLTWMVDALINFVSESNSDTINRALTRAGLHAYMDAQGLLALKRDGSSAEDGLVWRRMLQSMLADQVRIATNAKFSTPFFILPKDSRRGYWFVHLAQHLRANEEMKRIHWINNNLHHPGGAGINMLGYVGTRGQLAFDHRFDHTAQSRTAASLLSELPSRLASSSSIITFGDLVESTANETSAVRTQLQQAIFDLSRSKELILRTAKGSLRRGARGIEPDDTIEIRGRRG